MHSHHTDSDLEKILKSLCKEEKYLIQGDLTYHIAAVHQMANKGYGKFQDLIIVKNYQIFQIQCLTRDARYARVPTNHYAKRIINEAKNYSDLLKFSNAVDMKITVQENDKSCAVTVFDSKDYATLYDGTEIDRFFKEKLRTISRNEQVKVKEEPRSSSRSSDMYSFSQCHDQNNSVEINYNDGVVQSDNEVWQEQKTAQQQNQSGYNLRSQKRYPATQVAPESNGTDSSSDPEAEKYTTLSFNNQ